MKRFLPLFAFILTFFNAFSQQPITFHPKDNFVIVMEDNASPEVVSAAQFLKSQLDTIFSRSYKIVPYSNYHGKQAIIIGKNKLSQNIFQQYGNQIRDDGFLIHTDGKNLYFLGNENTRAPRYAVCHFLENYLGCSYTSAFSIHYSQLPDKLTINIHDLQNPSFLYRETLHLIPNQDTMYAVWHKLHNRADFNRDWGLFVHTFQHLIPVSTYFDAHPEWFSEMHGQRVRDGQLCLSNPEVLEELCKNLEIRMKAEPEKQIWSVSQNDNESSCTCPHCRHLDSLYGGPTGTMIWFVNQVAARFPDKTISTLAYQQTRHTPKNILPAKNVNIMLCSIECGRQKPIAADHGPNSFQRDLEEWTQLTHNILLWDYVVQFRNYMDPFPNLHVIQPNLQNFRNHGVPMMFEQGSGQNVTENYEWRTYLIAHLLWNADIDVDSLRSQFLNAHYGSNRARFIEQYYDTMRDALLASGQFLNIYGYPINAKDGYLAPDKVAFYQSLFEKAYSVAPFEGCSAAEISRYNDRLRLLELSLDFAVLELSMSDISPELSYFFYDSLGQKKAQPKMLEKLDKFIQDCDRLGVKYLDEIKYNPQQLRQNVVNYIKKSLERNISVGKRVTCSTEWSPLYDVGGAKALTDGNFGIMNYNFNWLGFWGQDMDVVIDLDSVQEVHRISADFLFYPLSWIFAPKKVTCYISDNQEDWTEIATRSYENEKSLAECKLVNFSFEVKSQRGRYVRVRAESLLKNPEWHRGVGQPCWIFCDEVIVR